MAMYNMYISQEVIVSETNFALLVPVEPVPIDNRLCSRVSEVHGLDLSDQTLPL